MKKFHRKIFVLFPLTLFIFALKVLSQSTAEAQNGCLYMEKDKPSLFISYEKEITEKNANGQNLRLVLLRLHNNSTCSIEIETSDITGDETLFRKEIKNLPNGIVETKFIPNLPEGARLPIFYDIQEDRSKAIKPANYSEDRDLVYNYTISPGRSTIFAVDALHFQKRFTISVPFTYSWEKNKDLHAWGGAVIHHVFYAYELPKGFYKN